MADQLAVVTGGSRGLGASLVRELLQRSDVLSLSRSLPDTVAGSEYQMHAMSVDLGDPAGLETALTEWFAAHPGYQVSTVIHNAATIAIDRLKDATPESMHHAFQVNVVAPISITTFLSERNLLDEANGARVAFVVSSLGRPRNDLSFAGIGVYSACKAALGRLAQVQQREFALAGRRIEVARIHPGIVATDMQESLRTDPRVDPAFADKTAGLPNYQAGEWSSTVPSTAMRTISADFAAQFVLWVLDQETLSDDEYDFYATEQFHLAHCT